MEGSLARGGLQGGPGTRKKARTRGHVQRDVSGPGTTPS